MTEALWFGLGSALTWVLGNWFHRRELRKLTDGYLLAANRMVDEAKRKEIL